MNEVEENAGRGGDCVTDLKRNANSIGDNQDGEPPLKCQKQGDDDAQASSTKLFNDKSGGETSDAELPVIDKSGVETSDAELPVIDKSGGETSGAELPIIDKSGGETSGAELPIIDKLGGETSGAELPIIDKSGGEASDTGLFFFIDNSFVIDESLHEPSEEPSPYTADFIDCEDEEAESPKDAQPSMECFNCGGNHHMNECTKEIDRARVSQRRREMAMDRDAKKKIRYFEHEMMLQRYRPGKLSKELRRALDLRSQDLPTYIYRMRVLGYPPGWLKDAEIESSGLKIYGLDHDDENVEDGEIDSDEKQVQYDPARLVSFPGFNVPVPPGVRDLHEKYGMPPMLPHQQRSEAEKFMKAPVAKSFNQRQKLPSPAVRPSTDIGQVVDMNIDDGDEDEQVCFEASCSYTVTTSDSNQVNMPASQGDSVHSPSSTASDSHNENAPSSTQSDAPKQPSPDTAENGSTCSTEDSTSEAPKVAPRKVTSGTPMLLGFSKYTCLPPRENFAKGVSEYIPFENLPGTTGRYNKLRVVLEKIRAMRKENKPQNGEMPS